MTCDDRQKWDNRYANDKVWQRAHDPLPWLVEHVRSDQNGVALDLACGLGHNALWLARQGYRVLAVDGSMVGLRRGLAAVRDQGLAGQVRFAQADLDCFRPPAGCCDLVCVLRFLNRDLFPWLIAALRPGGLLVVATLNWRWSDTSPDTDPEYLLKPGELLRAFPGLQVIDHLEEADMSYLAAFKPPTP
jgi:SAM-dependent methyltransferase